MLKAGLILKSGRHIWYADQKKPHRWPRTSGRWTSALQFLTAPFLGGYVTLKPSLVQIKGTVLTPGRRTGLPLFYSITKVAPRNNAFEKKWKSFLRSVLEITILLEIYLFFTETREKLVHQGRISTAEFLVINRKFSNFHKVE